MKEVVYLTSKPNGSHIHSEGWDHTNYVGWYWKYKVIPCYHGPYATEELAKAAIVKYA